MKLSKWKNFLLWFTPLTLLFLGYTLYIMTLSNLPYALGLSYLFNSQNNISISTPDIYEQASPYVIIELQPGGTAHARARIRNLTNHDTILDVFPLDAIAKFKIEDPEYKLKSKSANVEEVGKWITLPSNSLSLKKHKEDIIEFKISVPENTALGDYAGGVAIEESDSPSDIAPEGIVRIKNRYVMRVYIKITDTPSQPMYKTWEQILETHHKLVRIHSTIVITNLLILIAIFVYFKPKKIKK